MRRVKGFLDRARGSHRSIVLFAALAFAVAAATAVHAVVREGEVLTTTASEDVGAARRAPKVVTSAMPSTTTTTVTTTTIAAPAVEPAAVATTAPPQAAPLTTRAPAPPVTEAPAAAEPAPPPPPPPAPAGGRCLVRLHGKGGSGGGTHRVGDVTIIQPNGNAPGWSGRQWLYFAPSSYAGAAAPIIAAVDAAGCGQVIVNGFSNGGAMAMKLYCSGETFGGRLVGVVVDDPVPDHGANGCARPGGVDLTVYWTGALEHPAQPGWNCAEQDWTCEGGTTVGIGAYAANAGVAPKASPYGSHTWYADAPETQAWR